jgi:hypothetical protein
MRLRTTSIERTYRYLRLSIVGVVVFLGVGVGAQLFAGGALTSVSAAYYTPAQGVFVGSLCAIALALIALSGRSVEQALLDLAALTAPVIALVPTPVEDGDVAGFDPGCAGDASCVPAAVAPAVATGMLALLGIGVVGVAGAVVLAVVQRTLSVALGVTLALAAAIVGGGAAWWLLAPASFLLGAHNTAAIVFFALVAAVAALAARHPAASDPLRRTRLRVAYGGVSVGITAALIAVAGVVVLRAVGIDLVDATGLPLILIGEAVAIVLFAIFWLVQTVELWNEPDPAIR